MHMCANNLSRVVTWMERPGLEPIGCNFVRHPKHYATTPHRASIKGSGGKDIEKSKGKNYQ